MDAKTRRKHLIEFQRAHTDFELTHAAIELLERVKGTSGVINQLQKKQQTHLRRMDAAASKLGAPYGAGGDSMTTTEIAGYLYGAEYGRDMVPQFIIDAAKQAGIVIVHGDSDDLVRLLGAIDDEVDAYNGTEIFVTDKGLLRNECHNPECRQYSRQKEEAAKIKAIWNDLGDPFWEFETDIPHKTFIIVEEDEQFCRGIVFALADIPAAT